MSDAVAFQKLPTAFELQDCCSSLDTRKQVSARSVTKEPRYMNPMRRSRNVFCCAVAMLITSCGIATIINRSLKIETQAAGVRRWPGSAITGTRRKTNVTRSGNSCDEGRADLDRIILASDLQSRCRVRCPRRTDLPAQQMR